MAVKKAAENTQMQQASVGSFHRQLRQPQQVGEITAGEAREIKTLNDLLKRLEDDAQHAQRLLAVSSNYRIQYLRGLLTARNLPTEDLYNISDDTGLIMRTHELAQPEAVPEPETAAQEN